MKASDPHKNDSIDIESYLNNGWIAYGENLDDGIVGEVYIGDDGKPIVNYDCVVMLPLSYHRIKNVLIGDTFFTIKMFPPYDGLE